MNSGNGSEPIQPLPLAYQRPGESALQLPFSDQRGGLKTMGVVLIALGALSACLGAMTPIALLAPKVPGVAGPALRDLVAGLAIFLFGATLLIGSGSVSLRVKRSARPVVMVIAGTWAVGGLLAFTSWLLFSPSMNEMAAAINAQAAASASTAATQTTTSPTTAPAPAVVPAMSRGFGVVSGVFMLIFFVFLPTGLFSFYRRESVQQTLDYFDPGPGWTDRSPIPVLSLSFVLLISAFWMLGLCAWGVVPAFGRLLSGPPAVAVAGGTAVLLIILATVAYRGNPAAWWITAAIVVLGIASAILTVLRVDPLEMYRLAGTAPEQIELMDRIGANRRWPILSQISLYGVVLLAYLAWVRKFFRTPGPGTAVVS